MKNMPEKICLPSRLTVLTMYDIEIKKCYNCGKNPLTKDEVGLNRKLFDRKVKIFYCLSCMAEYLEVTEEELLAKIEEFKNDGCTLFK